MYEAGRRLVASWMQQEPRPQRLAPVAATEEPKAVAVEDLSEDESWGKWGPASPVAEEVEATAEAKPTAEQPVYMDGFSDADWSEL